MLADLVIKRWISGFIKPVAFQFGAEDLWEGVVVLVHSDENYNACSTNVHQMLEGLETSLGGKV